MILDALVLGGGFYGCKVALALHNLGLKVGIIEPGQILGGATLVNQGRVHSGMHYPRFFATALSAAKHQRRFITEHAQAIDAHQRHVYAIAKDSKTSPAEFERVAKEIGCPLTSIPMSNTFSPNLIEATYLLNEPRFNVDRLREMLSWQLKIANIRVARGEGTIDEITDEWVKVKYGANTVSARYVFNCTYSQIDKVVPLRTKIKKEWTEVAICELPMALGGSDITIMDGLYWSIMGHPTSGLAALTHVKYTPHHEWFGGDSPVPLIQESWFDKMQDDAARFVPAMRWAKYKRSLYTTRVVLNAHEKDDGRPILWEYHPESPRIISILGSKFNSVYDATDEIERGEWMVPQKATPVMKVGRRALVGRGFVGSTLNKPGRFTDFFNSTNVETMSGHYEQIVIAAPSGEKWKANMRPLEDQLSVQRLINALKKVTADEVVLLSTIDVFGVAGPYGYHRQQLEQFVQRQQFVKRHFKRIRIIRLPALFGPGLKKNVLFDLLHPSETVWVNPESTYQWYPIGRLWDDIQRIRAGDRDTVNLVTPAISVRWLIESFFPHAAVTSKIEPVTYRMNDEAGWIMTEDEVKYELRKFVEEECRLQS